MSERAKVTSVEALDAFKASLIVYIEKACRILDEVSSEVTRTRIWLQTDRRLHWQNQVRKQAKLLAQAEQEMLTARLAGIPAALQARRMAIDKAKLAVRDAEAGVTRVKTWLRQYDSQVELPLKAVAQLRNTLAHDMAKAVHFLEGAANALAAYTETTMPVSSAPPVTSELPKDPATSEGGGK